MTVRFLVRFSTFSALVGLLAVAFAVSEQAPEAWGADKPVAGPSHQVIACYFHRTVRCPTCKKISAYIDESVKTGFASQVKDGSVKMVMMDFQDPKNQQYTYAYSIEGPTLVLMDVRDGKVTAWKPAPKVWSLVGRKADFFKYVQSEIQDYLPDTRTASR
jgi:hypothetical protein